MLFFIPKAHQNVFFDVQTHEILRFVWKNKTKIGLLETVMLIEVCSSDKRDTCEILFFF